MSEIWMDLLLKKGRPSLRGENQDRWSRWVGALTARHARIAGRQLAATMTFLQPLQTMLAASYRWEHHSWNLRPKINLAIAVSLPQILRPQPTSLSMHLAAPRLMDSPTIRSTPAVNRVVRATRFEQTAEEPHPSNGTNQGRLDMMVAPSPLRLSDAPIVRTLQRSNEMSVTVAYGTRGVNIEECKKIVSRMVTERRRVEEQVTKVVQARTLVTPRSAHSNSNEFFAKETTHVSASSAPRQAQSNATSPPVNVEQLTEQVMRQLDRRITSWRERTGRV